MTTSSVQLGAAVDLTAMRRRLRAARQLQLRRPDRVEAEFHFLVNVHIGLAVEVFGENLCGVAFDGSSSGPGPWHLNGSGKVECCSSASSCPSTPPSASAPPPPKPLPLSVGELLIAELRRPDVVDHSPTRRRRRRRHLEHLSRPPDLAAARVLHPGGGLQVTERLVPLGIAIERFGGQDVPGSPTFWAIPTVYFGDDTKVDHRRRRRSAPTSLTAPSSLTVEQQLTINGFTSHPAGVQIAPTGLMCSMVGSHQPQPGTTSS